MDEIEYRAQLLIDNNDPDYLRKALTPLSNFDFRAKKTILVSYKYVGDIAIESDAEISRFHEASLAEIHEIIKSVMGKPNPLDIHYWPSLANPRREAILEELKERLATSDVPCESTQHPAAELDWQTKQAAQPDAVVITPRTSVALHPRILLAACRLHPSLRHLVR